MGHFTEIGRDLQISVHFLPGTSLSRRALPKYDYNSMTRNTNTILSRSIPNPQYKIYLNGRLTLTLITPNRPSRCVSWNYNPKYPCALAQFAIDLYISLD